MNDSTKSGLNNEPASEAEMTLHLLARLPAPEGLEVRVQARLDAAPKRATVLAWPGRGASGGWLQSAAAAAIVCVVAGGGWGIYTHAQPRTQMGGVHSPQVGAGGGFSTAGDMKVPTTVVGPTVAHPSMDEPLNPNPMPVRQLSLQPRIHPHLHNSRPDTRRGLCHTRKRPLLLRL